jgi:hypothetical protein
MTRFGGFKVVSEVMTLCVGLRDNYCPPSMHSEEVSLHSKLMTGYVSMIS